MRKYYLVTTEHLKEGLWFRDENDFRAGMNFVAIQAYQSKVTVLAFILMSNHLHFVVQGRWADVKAFIDGIKSRYSKYLNHKYGTAEFLRRNKVTIEEVSTLNEGLEKAIFNATKRSGKPLGSLSKRAKIRLLHCCKEGFPADWLVSEEGYILPESYVAVGFVERCYRRASRMNYFLVNSSKAKRKIQHADDRHPAFRDQVILAALPDLYRSLFGKQSFEELTLEEQTESLRQIQRRFCSNVHQIARVTGLTYEAAARMMDSV